MNQRADSLKKNLQPIVAQPLIYHSGWLLSHTHAPQQGRKSRKSNRKGASWSHRAIFQGCSGIKSVRIQLGRASARPHFRAHTAGHVEQNESAGS